MARQSKHALKHRLFCVSTCLALLISTASFAQSSNWPFSTPPPKGDGSTDDTKAIQGALNAAGPECATVQLACTQQNTYVVSAPIQVPKCVKFIGACGAVPFEGSETTIGTTLKFEPLTAKPGQPQPEIVTDLPKIVVSFHDAPGATLSGISIDCNNVPWTVGILYDSDNKPTSSFLNVDNLMIKSTTRSRAIHLQ